MPVSIGMIVVGIPVSVVVVVSALGTGTVGLGSVGASPRTVRVKGLSVVELWSDFAMLQEGKERLINKITPGWPAGRLYLAICNSSVPFRASP